MANKAVHRTHTFFDENLTAEQKDALKKQKATRYTDRYAQDHYRTIGFKCNVDSEKDLLAWLDSRPQLKPYLKKLIVEDMQKNPEELAHAINLYEAAQEAAGSHGQIRKGDVIMKCEYCGETTVIRRSSFFNKPDKHICPSCGKKMEAVNPPDKILNN